MRAQEFYSTKLEQLLLRCAIFIANELTYGANIIIIIIPLCKILQLTKILDEKWPPNIFFKIGLSWCNKLFIYVFVCMCGPYSAFFS